MKTRNEMINYLGLEEDIKDVVDTAMEMQKTYDLNTYGLALENYFESMPYVLEDLKDNEKLIEIERENGIVVYKKVESED